MARNSAGFNPGLKSTSQPRSEKISTARGESSSEMSTLGFAIFALDLCVGPIEPGQQGQKIRLLDSRAAPDAEPRRRVAVGTDVVTRLLAFEQIGHLFGCGSLLVGRKYSEPGCDDVEAHRGVGAGSPVPGEEGDPPALG